MLKYKNNVNFVSILLQILILEVEIMNNFSFYNPTTIIFGKNTISQIGDELRKKGISSVLLLAGSGSIRHNGVYDTAVKSLNNNDIRFIEHWGVRPNPIVEHAREGIELIKIHNLQAVLAIGGGSVIDEGKSIAVGYYLDDVWQAFDKSVVPQKALPVFTILTLSGTGTESNRNAVLSNKAMQLKLSLYSDLNFPKVSIIDPSVQISLPWNQTVNGGVDAITHCMENYFTGTGQETTISISEALMRTIIRCLDELQISPTDYDWRANLSWASVLALNGISAAGMNGGDWATHKLQHAISAIYPDVAHGPGLAAIFPSWLLYCSRANPQQFARWAKNVWGADSVEQGVQNMVSKFKKWGIPVSIKELGVMKEDLPAIVQKCLGIAPVIGGLVKLSQQDIEAIYEMAW